MALKNVHPSYTALLAKWQLCLDCYAGEDAVKQAGATYLPPTSGQRADGYGIPGSLGQAAYEAYVARAVFPDLYAEAVEIAVGILHKEPPKIDLPAGMEIMRENCSLLGESLEAVLRKINTLQLMTGRLGVLADLRVDGANVRPVIILYSDKAVRNWDSGDSGNVDVDVRLVVLDESAPELQADLSWQTKQLMRVLCLVNPSTNAPENLGVYRSAAYGPEDDPMYETMPTPSLQGKTLGKIPFCFINSRDLSPTPDSPPLEGLARACISIYRSEADYRQSLFMQGQDTLVRIGIIGNENTPAVRTGAGSCIDVPMGGDAKYIGVSSSGLAEQRSALENDYNRAIQKSGQLLDSVSRAKESGEALKIRVAAQTATLPLIAKAGAAGLEKVLRIVAEWYGFDPAKVVVTPNLNFTEADLNGDTLIKMLTAKNMGAPLSEESIHKRMQELGFTDITYEDELERISNEEPLSPPLKSPVDNEEQAS